MDYRSKSEVVAKVMDEVKELKNLVKELKADAVEKDTHLDHLQKRNDELRILLVFKGLLTLVCPFECFS